MIVSHALVIQEPKRVVFVEDEISEPGDNQVLIRATCTLISTGTEMTAYTGEFPPERSAWARYVRYPFRPGYSYVGRVLKVGRNVTELNPGDRVFCPAPHSSLTLQSSERVVAIPEGISDYHASFANISSIAMNGVRMARIELGEAVVVVGLGIVGQMALQYSRLSGAFPLVAVDISESRLHFASLLGATHVVNPEKQDVLAAILSITKGRKADVVFEVTGNPAVVPSLPPLLRRGGRLILLGSPRGKTVIDFHDEVHTYGLHIIGAHASNHPSVETPFNQWTRRRNIELFFDLLSVGAVSVDKMITHRYPWRQAAEVYRRLAEDRTGTLGVILEWDTSSYPGGGLSE